MSNVFFDTDLLTSQKKEETAFFGKDMSKRHTKFKNKSIKTLIKKDFVFTSPLTFTGDKLGLDTSVRTQEYLSSKEELLELIKPIASASKIDINKLF